MKGFFHVAAVVAAGLASTARAQDNSNPQQPTQAPGQGVTLRTFTPLGCYSDPGNMWDMGSYTFQTNGWCQPLCVRQGATYFGLVNGTNCFCGTSSPDSSNEVSSSECDTYCSGFQSQNCGGSNRWAIYADGFRNGDSTGTIQITTPTQTWFGHSATSSGTTLKTSVGQQSTVVVTASSTAGAANGSGGSGSSPNKAAIAAGVVVGVVAFAAIIGAIVFYVRRHKRRDVETERRKHESIMRIVTKGEKPPSAYSASDSRLEPSVMFQRRQSDGSIMDNQDYSRRILKVTNPDDR